MNLPISLGRPELVWLCLLAPLLAAALVAAWRQRVRAAISWAGPLLWRRLLPGYRAARQAAWIALLAGAVLCVAIALARPRWGVEERRVTASGVDVAVVLDSSLSMGAQDVTPDRLTVAKILLRQLLAALPEHRIALVQAEGEGVLLSPLTLDHAVIDLLLDAVETASLPTPGTRLANGFELALEALPAAERRRGAILVLSDGEDHGSDWSSARAAAERAGVVVHAVGIGTREGATLAAAEADGARRTKLDETGRPVVSRLQPQLLEELAAETGGVYVEVATASADVTAVADRVRDLSGAVTASETIQQARERFAWFLAPAAACLLLALAIGPSGSGERRR